MDKSLTLTGDVAQRLIEILNNDITKRPILINISSQKESAVHFQPFVILITPLKISLHQEPYINNNKYEIEFYYSLFEQ